MKTKKKALLVVAFIMAIAVCCVALAACGGKQVAITWKVDENATVAVTGYKSLPAKVKDGESISFTVTPKEHYAIDTVKVGTSPLKAENGIYTHTVTGESCEIEVTTKKLVESLEVTTNPTKLTYYAGDMIDLTGMVITAKYEDGTSEVITKYKTSTAVASLGDTKFTVSYEGKSVDVTYDQAVEVLIELDTDGGKVTEEYLKALEANADVKNFKVTDAGNISFTYSELGADITLPVATEISKGTEGDYDFNCWYADGQRVTKIETKNDISAKLTAVYKINAVTYNSAKLVVEDGKPLLVLNVTFKAIDKAQIFLYEGNKKVFIIDEKIYTGKKGEAFDLKCDLTALGQSDHNGAWMDIRLIAIDDHFNPPTGEDVEEELVAYYEIHSQTLSLDPENMVAQLPNQITSGGKTYYFLVYNTGESVDLKVVFQDEAAYTYGFEMKDVEGKPVLVVSGTATDEHKGKVVTVRAHEATGTGQVGTDGKWSADIDLTKITTLESFSNIQLQFGDGEAFAPNISYCTTNLDTFIGDLNFGTQYQFAHEFTSANGFMYYISINWNEPAIYAIDVAHKIVETNSTLEMRNEKPYFVIEGTYGEGFATPTEAIEALKQRYSYVDVETFSWSKTIFNFAGVGEDEEPLLETMFVEAADGKFKLLCDLTAIKEADFVGGAEFFMHYTASKRNLEMKDFDQTTKLNFKGFEISLGRTDASNDSWKANLVIIKLKNAAAIDFTMTGFNLEVANEKVYAVLTGTVAEGTTLDALKAGFKADCMEIAGSYKTVNFTFTDTPAEGENPAVPANSTVTLEGTTYTVKFDLSAMGDKITAGNHFMFHYFPLDKKTDFKLDPQPTITPVTVGGLTYSVGGSGKEGWANSLTCILLETAA